MNGTVRIQLNNGEAIELFENNKRLLVNIQSKNGYDKDNVVLSKSQIEGLRELVDRFEVTTKEELSQMEVARMDAIQKQRQLEREQT